MISLFKKKKRYFLVVVRGNLNGSIATVSQCVINNKGGFPAKGDIIRLSTSEYNISDLVILNIIEFKSRKDFESYIGTT